MFGSVGRATLAWVRWAVFTIAGTVPAGAQDHPSSGQLYSLQERADVTHACRPIQGGEIACRFEQASIRPSDDEDETQAELELIRDDLNPECVDMRDLREAPLTCAP